MIAVMKSAEKGFNTTIINMFKYLRESRNTVRRKKIFKKNKMGASLVAQWLRIHLPM